MYFFPVPVLAKFSETICKHNGNCNLIYHSDVAVAVAVVFRKLANVEATSYAYWVIVVQYLQIFTKAKMLSPLILIKLQNKVQKVKKNGDNVKLSLSDCE